VRRASLAGVVVAALATGCAPRPAASLPTLPDPTAREWTRLRERLAIARDAAPTTAYVEHLVLAMREPRTGKVFQARGAVAVDPGRALRMILVGPGGVTALDAWVTDARFRFEVPGIAYVRRGGVDPAAERGLPIGFLRWWILHPLDGRLLAGWTRDDGALFLLRQGDETVLLREGRSAQKRRTHVVAALRDGASAQSAGRSAPEGGRVQRLEWYGSAPGAPHAGDMARYIDGASGLEVEVKVEDVQKEPPDGAAFLDPDSDGTSPASPERGPHPGDTAL
jgi:hypothetical protein